MSPRIFTWVFVFAAVGAFALGTINIMRLRVEADAIGSRIQRIERDISLSKKELEAVRRQRDQFINTLELQQRIGDAMKPPSLNRWSGCVISRRSHPRPPCLPRAPG